MKKLLAFLVFLFVLQVSVHASPEGDYPPVINMKGKVMDLRTGKTLETFRQQLLDAHYKDITEVLKPKLKNVCVMEGYNKNVAITYEIYYLPDGRIYELVMSMDTDKEGKENVYTKMTMQKIAFNNISNALYKELGSPTISEMQWDAPYTSKDWEDAERTAAALTSNKLFIFFGYVPTKY
jgi:hypothetical protein